MTMLLLKLRVMSFIPTGLLCLFAFTATDVEGYASSCNSNQTMFLPEESTLTFQIDNSQFDYYLFLVKTAPKQQNVFHVRPYGNDITDDDLRFSDRSWENRTHISGQRNSNNGWDIRIEISNISMKDNGTYRADALFTGERFCITLFVMQIRLSPRDVTEENEPVYLYAHPHSSLINRPLANATMVWLLNGIYVNQTASVIQQDGLIWIPHITRGLDGRNVTYRAVLDSGDVKEVNFTLDITYGPSQPLALIPGQTQYYLMSGDVMPDITCTSDCKPPCSISWGNYSIGGTLSLGTVTPNDTGEYTCTATRTGVKTVEHTVKIQVSGSAILKKDSVTKHAKTKDEQAWPITITPQKAVYIMSIGETMPDITCTADCNPPCNVSWGIHSPDRRLTLGTVSKDMKGDYICTATRRGTKGRVEKVITIHVQDNTSFTIAIACLATVQALTTLGLGLCAFLIYRRNKQSQCQTCFKTSARQSSNRNTCVGSKSTVEDSGLQHYEDLDTDTRYVTTVSREVDLPMAALPTEAGLEIYENTKVSPTSTQGVTLTHK